MLLAWDREPEPVARHRLVLCELPQDKQPYHAAENMALEGASASVADHRAATLTLAVRALQRSRGEVGAAKFATADDVALHHTQCCRPDAPFVQIWQGFVQVLNLPAS